MYQQITNFAIYQSGVHYTGIKIFSFIHFIHSFICIPSIHAS